MANPLKRSAIVTFAALLAAGALYGQGRGGGGGWSTSRGDAQRTAWVRTDSYVSVEGLQKPGFGLEWSVKVGHTPHETISEAVSTNTTQLDPQPGDIAGSGNNLYGYEVDTGSITWTKHFDVPTMPAATAACPGGLSGGVTRLTSLDQAINGATPGRGGRGPGTANYVAGVGGPGEGVPPELTVRAGRGGRVGPAAPGGPPADVASRRGGGATAGAGAAVPPVLFNRGTGAGGPGMGPAGAPGAAPRIGLRGAPAAVYVLSSDGALHAIGQAQGKELTKPLRFLPANANASSLILVGDTMYAATINGCSGAANGVWAINIKTGAVSSWKSGASPAGLIAFSPDGTLYVAIGDGAAGPNGHSDAVVALDPNTLTAKDWFTMPGAAFSSGPVIFPSGERQLLAVAAKDGRVFLLDTGSLGGSDHKTALAVSPPTTTSKTWAPSALATWEDDSHGRYLLLPAMSAKGVIVALKVVNNSLEQAWTSSTELASPSAPIVVNGVVFALNQGSANSPAALHAFDGSSGKEIWNSGTMIKSFVRSAGLWSINGQVHVATADASVYAFGTGQGRHL